MERIDREVTMTTSRRSLLRNSAATVAAVSLGSKLVRAQEPPIRIGVIYDLSGPFAAAGSVPCAIGAQIAIDLVNERGGVAAKYKVQPINADSQSKADAAINEVERLLNQEKVEIVLGVYASAHAVPLAAKVEAQKKILWITTAIATSVVKDQNRQYVFRAQIHSDQYGQAFAAFLAENAKAKLGLDAKDIKVAIIHEDGPYGVGVAQATEQFAKERGLQIVLREGYSRERAGSFLPGDQAQTRRLRCHFPLRVQPRHHPIPAPGARGRAALQDAGRKWCRL
jgi:branched-chain amino acid transport system substrate-binding protein